MKWSERTLCAMLLMHLEKSIAHRVRSYKNTYMQTGASHGKS